MENNKSDIITQREEGHKADIMKRRRSPYQSRYGKCKCQYCDKMVSINGLGGYQHYQMHVRNGDTKRT